MPTHIMVNFDPAGNIETALRRQIASCHWEVASTAAYPTVLVASRDGLRAADADELRIAEALALAMPAWLVPRQKLRRAGEGRGSHTLRTAVATCSREVEVELRFPFAG